MDLVDVCAATSTADSSNNKRRVHKRNRDWLNRLHLRKAALQPPAMQNPDKQHGPKKIAAAAAAEERASTTWSKKRPNHDELQRTIRSGNSLRFKCSQCADGVERAPKDLLKHFDEKHKGCPPVFSCDMCKFTTHEFSYLQVHVLSHKDTFSCCSLCKDNVQRTWAEFSAHLMMVHTQNGKYTCEVCKKFSTSDDKEFLEHVLLHNLGLDLKSEQAIGNMAACKCQFCGYEASQKMLLTKHVKATHGSVNCSQRNADAFSASEPKGKPRVTTRSAVKDLSWLTQDCLSLPGREFLDKYCHLSDAKTTLEETEQFLVRSGKRRWSKALKNVLSNVPRDASLQAKAENGGVSVSPDSSQDVLTVKNKMNQNGGSFVKRLKLMTEKEVGSADADSCGKIASDTGLSGCLQNQEIKLSGDVLIAEPTEGPTTEENRENQRLKTHLNERNAEEATQDAVTCNDRKAVERKADRRALPKKKRKNMRWRNMKRRAKKADESQTALALKIVLKKNPKTGKQWVTQTSKPAPSRSQRDPTTDEMKSCYRTEVCGGEVTIRDGRKTTDCRAANVAGKRAEEIGDGGRSVEGEMKEEGEREVGADSGGSAELKTPDGSTEASPLAQPVITAHSEAAHPAVSPPPPVAQTQEALPTDTSLRSSTSESSPTPPPPPPPLAWTPAPKALERTLHLVAVSPEQPVKRPAGSQPVVVLNHPDADLPEVSRIMGVVKKYKGEIHKVVLSKRTLSAIDGQGRGPEIAHNNNNNALKNPVRERFLLKLKLRRLSRKRFEVISDGSSSIEGAQTFRCWFCGRVFGNQEVWLSHRQRHLREWKTSNCENS